MEGNDIRPDKDMERQRLCLLTHIKSTNELLNALLITCEVLGLGNHDSVERYCGQASQE